MSPHNDLQGYHTLWEVVPYLVENILEDIMTI
jgi:hypothetical protein